MCNYYVLGTDPTTGHSSERCRYSFCSHETNCLYIEKRIEISFKKRSLEILSIWRNITLRNEVKNDREESEGGFFFN